MAKKPTPEELKLMQQILATPVGFAAGILGLKMYPWQNAGITGVCCPIGRNRTAICAPNGSGKSERVVAASVLWWLSVHPRGKVVVTTADGKQLDGQIIPAIWSHRAKFPNWRFVEREITTPTGGFAKFWTTDEPGRAEGWHGKEGAEEPLLIIVDEAKSVPEKIFEALDRCTFQSILYISSPGLMQGRFFDAFNKHADRYFKLQVGLRDCPHISKEKIADIISQYGGENHPFVRSCLHGEFMDNSAENYLFSLYDVQRLWAAPPNWQNGRRIAYCDFAGGGDENVIALREGNRIVIEKAWRESNEMIAVHDFIRIFKKLGLRPEDTYGDVCGAGKVMISRFEELGWMMHRVNGGLAPAKRDFYKNAATEMWAETSLAVRRQDIILPEDQVLLGQLTTRKIKYDAKGRFWMETKEELKERGIPSPDRADAICGAYWCGGMGKTLVMKGGLLEDSDIYEDTGYGRMEIMSGMHAGL